MQHLLHSFLPCSPPDDEVTSAGLPRNLSLPRLPVDGIYVWLQHSAVLMLADVHASLCDVSANFLALDLVAGWCPCLETLQPATFMMWRRLHTASRWISGHACPRNHQGELRVVLFALDTKFSRKENDHFGDARAQCVKRFATATPAQRTRWRTHNANNMLVKMALLSNAMTTFVM